MHQVTVLPKGRVLTAEDGENLLALLRREGLIAEAPCGGQGTCGKCAVLVDGEHALSCRTVVKRSMTVTVHVSAPSDALTETNLDTAVHGSDGGYRLAIDIGTTTLAACLMDGKTGAELGSLGAFNPQSTYGADVISRIRYAQSGHASELTEILHDALNSLTDTLCASAGISAEEIEVVSVVGNPAMQQLFLGLDTENLTTIPYVPVLTRAETVSAAPYLSVCRNARMQIVPDISAYVGADTVGCVLAAGLDRQDEITLLVDIGTNGEMVLGNRKRLVACSTAAGPALEGANIQFGMRGQNGAIDHVRSVDGGFSCSVIGGGEAEGICGSGLIDAVAASLDTGLINERGKILSDTGTIALTGSVSLAQEDIRQVQLAKGAIAAGIELLASHFGIALDEIHRVYLAGAFGTFMDAASACRIGLIPPVLAEKITVVGNAALGGAKLLACNETALDRAGMVVNRTEWVDLAQIPMFARCYARNMRF